MEPNAAFRVAKGELEWTQYGGSITRHCHPSGRITVTYMAPDGLKLRSWKTCLDYIKKHGKSKIPGKTCVESIAEDGPPSKIAGKTPKSRQKKKAMKSKGEVVELSDDSSPFAATPDEVVKLPRIGNSVMEEFPPRKSLMEELMLSAEEENDPSATHEVHVLPAAEQAASSLEEKPKPADTPQLESKAVKLEQKLDEISQKPLPRDEGTVVLDDAAGTVQVSHQERKQQKRSKTKAKATPPYTASGEEESDAVSENEVASEDGGGKKEVQRRSRKRAVDLSEEALGNFKKPKITARASGRQNKKKNEASDSTEHIMSDDDGEEVIRKNSSSRPKRAAAATNFKEKKMRLDEEDAKIESKTELRAEDETSLLMMTRSPSDEGHPERKVLDFTVHDGEGNLLQINAIKDQPGYLAGLCFPKDEALDKDKGVRCDLLGPVNAWSIMGYDADRVEIVLSTPMGDYYLDKPAAKYKRTFNPLFDKARVCREVYRALSRPDGGDPTMGLRELETRLIRLYCNMGSSGQFFSRDYFHEIGYFVAVQLKALDEDAPDGCQLFSGLRALEELQELSFGLEARRRIPGNLNIGSGNGTSNGDATAADGCALEDDYKLAQRLQYEENGYFDSAVDLPNATASRRGAARQVPSSKVYVKINEQEIANDYPEPAYYRSDEPETDEYVMFSDVHPDDENFPHRVLDDWTLYNSESRLVSLELIPMLPCAENDMQIFGSGVISEDDGSRYCHEDDGAGKCTEEGSGFRVFLSAVKEWKVEWGSGMIIISFKTDVSWYRLGTPSKQYVDWYAPVLKTAKIAVKIITMLRDQNRVSRLSFNDVVRKLVQQEKSEPTWISSKLIDVERYVIVHGNIILQQIEEFPDHRIQNCAFGIRLKMRMEQRKHEKLSVSKKRVPEKKEVNLNPRAKLASSIFSRTKPMRATTTQLVNRIWSGYFQWETNDAKQPKDIDYEGKDADIVADEQNLVEEDSDDDIVEVLQPPASLSPPKCTSPKYSTAVGSRSPKKSWWKSSETKVKWADAPIGKTKEGYPVYKKARYNNLDLTAGKVVVVHGEHSSKLFLIEYLYESDCEGPMIHGRLLLKGEETILGDAASEREIFLTDACTDIRIGRVKELAIIEIRLRDWGHKYRKENAAKDEADRARAKDRKRKGLPVIYFCRSLWSPERGGFFSISVGTLALGSGTCAACAGRQESEKKMQTEILPEGQGFRWQGVDYRINDFLYLDPLALKNSKPDSCDTPSEKKTHKGGRNKGLHPFIICQLLSIQSQKTKMKAASSTIKVRRFYRPEDVDGMKSYRAQLHEVYYSEEISAVGMSTVRGKCEVRRTVQDLDTSKGAFDHVFVCDYVHDPKAQTIKRLPANIRLGSSSERVEANNRTTRDKGKGKARVDEEISEQTNGGAQQSPALATLDIFAGCGGLSEGLHQSGVSVTKWAIEYDREAADAFKLNHPSAEVFCDNCNVVLRAIMEKGGDLDDCLSTPEADDLCEKMAKDMKEKLPVPGEVDFINGGPPCQGFSGMNRFNQSVWSKVQCEMILAFLSYADYYRPRYFLLENVRNFISFNKGQTFRLTVASLLEMGYQVRFGVLQAGNFGVAQSRKRAFIWAASPEELLPEWPEPRHVFASSQLGITLPGGGQYCAVRDAGLGAPFRAITVRDTIADLPAVENGAITQTTVYTIPAESWFQKQIRGDKEVLSDHISKEMNELNLIRCKRIPMRPGADWRDLPDEKVKLSTGQVVDLIPWCLPNTAARHNQWKGLFGRLDWDGNFPTSITDPQPMGKVGMCFHPVQNRIVTVRECARSQGFRDTYKFAGNLICKHRQIGNAVPPPLACALGYKLKEALNAQRVY